MPSAKEVPHYTYADFLEWDESLRTEIIDGNVYINDIPGTLHQEISGELFIRLYNFLKGTPPELYVSLGVRLFPRDDLNDDTVVIPDIVVICDSGKLDDRGCNGAPDLVIEILSPSTARHDRLVKFRKYQQAGVREYWIVDPDMKTVQACVLKNGWYQVTMYDDTDTVPVTVLQGCEIHLAEVFEG
ncbi:hypothetical protein FACS189450_10550 [Spirochaetia bacterium]|nr:hypothetical protein FACS189450_10550 [Spirochaetia bacterium]